MSTTKVAEEKIERTQPTPGPSKKSAREDRRARRRCETVDSIRLLNEALPLATDSTSEDSDDCSTIGNTSTAESAAESAMDTDGFQLPSARRQMKRKNSHNSSSESDKKKRPGTKTVAAEVSQPVESVPNHPQAKDARRPTGEGQMDGRKRRTGAARSPHDEGGQHQRRHSDPARLGSRLPPASPYCLRHEGTTPFVPTDGREACQGRHPRSLRKPVSFASRRVRDPFPPRLSHDSL
ncbi:hypothetical protein Trydic_g12409 [Trypoxylus dichotomus]